MNKDSFSVTYLDFSGINSKIVGGYIQQDHSVIILVDDTRKLNFSLDKT